MESPSRIGLDSNAFAARVRHQTVQAHFERLEVIETSPRGWRPRTRPSSNSRRQSDRRDSNSVCQGGGLVPYLRVSRVTEPPVRFELTRRRYKSRSSPGHGGAEPITRFERVPPPYQGGAPPWSCMGIVDLERVELSCASLQRTAPTRRTSPFTTAGREGFEPSFAVLESASRPTLRPIHQRLRRGSNSPLPY